MKYNLCYIGAGPATMFSLLRLVESGYKGHIAVIEKGKSLENRSPEEVISGSFGAGTYSDSKISKSLTVGGNLPITQDELDSYGEDILSYIRRFNVTDNKDIDWEVTKPFDTSPSSLQWSSLSVCHIGTERGRVIYKKIEDYLKSQSNIKFYFECEVSSLIDLSNKTYQIIAIKNGKKFILSSNKIIVATGQKSNLAESLIESLELSKKPRALQLGVRVEDKINKQYRKILNANYDFKFVKEYDYGDIKVRVRTFCCNSGNAHTCSEDANGYTCFNGHAYKTPDPSNNTVNYGIICEIEGLKEYSDKNSQINLMKKVNSIKSWKADNFSKGEVKPRRSLLRGFPQLKGYYPEEVLNSLNDFIKELNKVVDLSKAHYLYPEVKLSGYTPKLKDGYETEKENLYMIGDCTLSRGILKAGIMGIQFANHILEKEIKR